MRPQQLSKSIVTSGKRMKTFLIGCGLLVLLGAGCVSKSKANAQARAAYLAGKQQGMAMKVNGPSVWFVGNVHQPIVPWTEGLTLARALVTANYLGQNDPSQITIYRPGQPPTKVDPKDLLRGADLPLEAGDRIDIRP
jgi:hypothetical protein